MKTIALLLLFLLCVGLNSSFAQIKQGDLLIGRQEFQRMKKELANCRYKAIQLDSLEQSYNALLAENELLLYQYAAKLDKSEKKIASLQADYRKLNLAMQDQKARTNEYRYAYQHSGRFKERATISLLWASLMSVGFVMAAGENYTGAYIVAGSSAAVTIFLAIKAGKVSKKAPSL
jgi:septal ring factor EnvC (AmiA/AmiB activator)